MAVTFNESAVAAEPLGNGVARQRLLTPERVPGTNILLDRLTFAAGASFECAVPGESLAWFQMLAGEASIAHPQGREALSEAHVVFLPPGFRGTLASERGARLLYAEVPNATRFDPALAAHPPRFRVVDWTREPVLSSQHDARQRIYLVTPKLFGTKAIKGEMIIYPPGTTAANHHHEGAEHFMYILRGRGTAYASEQPFPVRAGDVVYYYDRERHYLSAGDGEEMVFAEFFAPGDCTTVWVDETQVCAWLPTGRDIRGGTPAREIKGHSLAESAIPQDV
ncbi:MAG: cupin domain-containing protein [Acidobacteriia bacterium]|nr:cupin domain-containing protein [Terriglobia bacterium]